MNLAFRNFAKIKKATKSKKLGCSRRWRGLLLGYGCMVFGDTSESVDEVNCPRFLFVSCRNDNKNNHEKREANISPTSLVKHLTVLRGAGRTGGNIMDNKSTKPTEPTPQKIKLKKGSLSVFIEEVEKLYKSHKGCDLIFRGQRSKEYPLIPSIGRKDKDTGEYYYDEKTEESIFNEFCRLYYPYTEHRPTRKLDMLFLAQHYRLHTRLLDWTFNPLIALFMACEQGHEEENDADCRIFIKVLQDKNQIKCDNEDVDPFNGFTENKIIMPDNIDIRYRNQQGIFEIFANPWEKSLNYNYYIDVHGNAKKQMLESLSHIGIDEKFIYPDMERLTSYLKEKYSNKTNNNKKYNHEKSES